MSNEINKNGNLTIAKNTIFLYGRMFVTLIVSLYTSRIVLSTLGIVDYGVYNVIAGFVSMFVFLNSALTASIQRYYNYERGINGEKGIEKVYNAAIVTQSILAVLVIISVEIIGLWYLNNKLVIPHNREWAAHIVFQLSLISIIAIIMLIPYSALVLSKERMNFYALVGILDTFLRLGMVVLLPYVPYDKLVAYACLAPIISGMDYLLYYIYVKRNLLPTSFKFEINIPILKSIFSFSGWNAVGSFSIMLRGQGVNMILNLFFGPVVNAARAVASSVQSAIMGFVYNIFSATRPQLTEAYAVGNYQRSTSLMFSVSKICFILIYFFALPIGTEIHYVLHLWLGDNVPQYAGEFTVINFAIILIDVLNTPVSMIMLATGKIKKYNLVASILGLTILPFSYLILKCGASPISVYYISLLISVIVQYVCLQIMHKETGISLHAYFQEVILPITIMVLLTVSIPLLIGSLIPIESLRFIISILVAFTIVLLVSYTIVFNKPEKQLIKNIFQKKVFNKK